MIGLDTNVLVRFLVNDDPVQGEKVRRLFQTAGEKGETFHVSLLVVQELIWVLDSVYECSRQEIIGAIDTLTRMPVFEFESMDLLHDFLNDAMVSNFDLPDLMIAHASRASGCNEVITFDRKASRHSMFRRLV